MNVEGFVDEVHTFMVLRWWGSPRSTLAGFPTTQPTKMRLQALDRKTRAICFPPRNPARSPLERQGRPLPPANTGKTLPPGKAGLLRRRAPAVVEPPPSSRGTKRSICCPKKPWIAAACGLAMTQSWRH
jgi:hypothetical protein